LSQNSEDPIAARLELSRATRDAALHGICDEIGQPLMREGKGK
jgi:hypothetical protein